MITITCPLHVVLPRVRVADKKCIINLNNYRNWHHHVSNDIKIAFKDAIKTQLDGVQFPKPCVYVFNYYAADLRLVDLENPCSILCKFFSDAATECGCQLDDNHKHLPMILHAYRGVDRENPRCEVWVLSFSEFLDNILHLVAAVTADPYV